MITLEYSNLTKVVPEHGVSATEMEPAVPLGDYLQRIHERKQGWYQVIDDQEMIDSVKAFADENRDKFDHFVVCGIGGSALGTRCLLNALTESKKLFVLDNVDPDFIKCVESKIDPAKTLFIVISKSGGTTETLSQYEYFKTKAPAENFVLIGGFENAHFSIPENVGGRFSVLTPVGLLPAALIGIDIDGLVSGAREMRDRFLAESDNPCFELAQIQYQLSKKGKNITVLYPYAQRLKYLADWYKQLLAESIGKADNVGLTPVSALGVTDQHSQSQLYMDGPFDKLIIFIEVEEFHNSIEPFNKLMKIEKQGTEEALTQKNKPSVTIQIPKVEAQALGGLFMLFEGSIAFLGEMFDINAFDQPGVELSKQLTKKYLDA